MKLHTTVVWHGRHSRNKIHSFISSRCAKRRTTQRATNCMKQCTVSLAVVFYFFTQLVKKCVALVGIKMCVQPRYKLSASGSCPRCSPNSRILILYFNLNLVLQIGIIHSRFSTKRSYALSSLVWAMGVPPVKVS